LKTSGQIWCSSVAAPGLSRGGCRFRQWCRKWGVGWGLGLCSLPRKFWKILQNATFLWAFRQRLNLTAWVFDQRPWSFFQDLRRDEIRGWWWWWLLTK